MSKHHNRATKILTLCQVRPVVKRCQELLSKGNLCNLNFDSLSSQAHNLQYKWLPQVQADSYFLLTFVKAIQKSNLNFDSLSNLQQVWKKVNLCQIRTIIFGTNDSPSQGWLLLLTFTNSHLTILTPSEVERLRDNSFDKVLEESLGRSHSLHNFWSCFYCQN